jgi:hypothetical protein
MKNEANPKMLEPQNKELRQKKRQSQNARCSKQRPPMKKRDKSQNARGSKQIPPTKKEANPKMLGAQNKDLR